MAEAHERQSMTAAPSDALVALHKEQFGRGPTRARTDFAGPDITVTVLHDALTPAEKALLETETMRVHESRISFQEATRDRFVETIERVTTRKVHSFHSTCNARNTGSSSSLRSSSRESQATTTTR
jgi:uncharacterized protein YbcI